MRVRFPEGWTGGVIAVFVGYLREYLRRGRQGTRAGYAVTVPEPKDPIACFPPTSLDFFTNPYRDAQEKPRGRDLDTINYLMMTGNAPHPQSMSSWSGNFVTPADGVDNTRYGTMAVSRDLFVCEFLLPRLAPLVCGHWVLQDARGGLGISKTAAVGDSLVRTPEAPGEQGRSPPRASATTSSAPTTRATASPGMSTWPSYRVRAGSPSPYGHVRHRFQALARRAAASFSGKVTYKVPLVLTVTLSGAVDGKLQVGLSPAGTSSHRPPHHHRQSAQLEDPDVDFEGLVP